MPQPVHRIGEGKSKNDTNGQYEYVFIFVQDTLQPFNDTNLQRVVC